MEFARIDKHSVGDGNRMRKNRLIFDSIERWNIKLRHVVVSCCIALSVSGAVLSVNSKDVGTSTQDQSAKIQAVDERWEGVIEDARRPVVINVDFKAKRISLNGGSSLNMSPESAIDSVNRVKFELVNGPQTL